MKQLHLIVSILIIVPVALVYGFYPQLVLDGTRVEAVSLVSVFRAMMGLYLGMCVVWGLGIIKPGLWFTATVVNVVFMGGLAIGRLVSLVMDGMPGVYFMVGFVVEVVLAVWGVRNLKRYRVM